MDKERYALLDTDFISKLHITRKNDHERMIDQVISLPNFSFYVHEQIVLELKRHNSTASDWLEREQGIGHIRIYTDQDLLEMLGDYFGKGAFSLYMSMLKNSCDVMSKDFYMTYYYDALSISVNKDLHAFVSTLRECDKEIGENNNLGEIKTYTLVQVFEIIGLEKLFVFCSDDKKARRGIAVNADVNCVSAIASFYLTRKYLNMSKEEALEYFQSWMKFHESINQTKFKIYEKSKDNRLIPIDGYEILDRIYDGSIGLYKDGYLKLR